jgi:hypothetical protein
MLLLSSLFLCSIAAAVELKLETSLSDNPDKVFVPVSRSSLLVSSGLEHKAKAKHAGLFVLARTKLDYQHDLEAQRQREGELSATVLAVKPLKEFLLGASIAGGHLWRWRRDFNVNTSRYGEIDGDHFFLETRAFAEKKLTPALALELNLVGRLEDYASTYSLYVNEENDNISGTLAAGLGYKSRGLELKPGVSFARKLWRERRALSDDGFFVAAGEKLEPDRIDTLTASVKSTAKFSQSTFSVTPAWHEVRDLVNGGRSWTGPVISSEITWPMDSVGLKLKADWSKREYESQLSTFQSSGDEPLEEESRTLVAGVSFKFKHWSVEASHSNEQSRSNQTDAQDRKIGMIKSATTALSVQRAF